MVKVVRLEKILEEAKKRKEMGESLGKDFAALRYISDFHLLSSLEEFAEEVEESELKEVE